MSAAPTAERATVEELTMIRDYVMMPHMLTMCDRILEDVRRSGNLFAKHFEQFIQLVMDGITRDLNMIRREFRTRQIKVWDRQLRNQGRKPGISDRRGMKLY
ncbi:hypothetical protein [Cohnella mopanensis]|uniref:hypothetical protein n=1 Tax=Cohnella mopanensis TaxID=2911966 RepID=UPI001EF7CA31|nr:hypothetical protein [Cohnella mopanensis]